MGLANKAISTLLSSFLEQTLLAVLTSILILSLRWSSSSADRLISSASPVSETAISDKNSKPRKSLSIPHEPHKLYEDILQSIDETLTFCQGKTFRDFQEDRGLQLIVERELEIMREALA